jgi:hypothetical protein
MDIYVEEIRAAARCAGWNLSQFLYFALLEARNKVAEELGISPSNLGKLSKRECDAIGRKYRLALVAQSNQTIRPERN